ncbi:MAG: ExbD/TolR family protein [Pseudomonadales bacterium]
MNFRPRPASQVDVNLTPLIDVVFLLLIFFMVSTTFTKETHLEIDLPEASAEPTDQKQQDKIEVVINASGGYSVNGRALVNNEPATLSKALREIAGKERSQAFVITADAKTPHQSVVTAMDTAGQLGFIHLSITTSEPVVHQ